MQVLVINFMHQNPPPTTASELPLHHPPTHRQQQQQQQHSCDDALINFHGRSFLSLACKRSIQLFHPPAKFVLLLLACGLVYNSAEKGAIATIRVASGDFFFILPKNTLLHTTQHSFRGHTSAETPTLIVGREGVRKKFLFEECSKESNIPNILGGIMKRISVLQDDFQNLEEAIVILQDDMQKLEDKLTKMENKLTKMENEQVTTFMYINLRQLVQDWREFFLWEDTALLKETKKEYIKRNIKWVSNKSYFVHEVLAHKKIINQSNLTLKNIVSPCDKKAIMLKRKIRVSQSCLNACLAMAKQWLPYNSKKVWNEKTITQYFLLLEFVDEVNYACLVDLDMNMLSTILERAKKGIYSYRGKPLGDIVQKIAMELQQAKNVSMGASTLNLLDVNWWRGITQHK